VAKKEPSIPPDSLVHYDRLVSAVPEIERKGVSVPYTSHNGHMFSYLNEEGKMALKLPSGEREAFLEKYQTTLFHAYGIVQKEFVTVPDELLADTEALKPYLQRSFEFVQTLKPKPTKK
jgi:hypothetical protein